MPHLLIMKTVTGVFRFYQTARDAAGALRRAGFSENQVNLLSPGSPESAIHSIATSDTEQSGADSVIRPWFIARGAQLPFLLTVLGVLGGALGLAGGFELGVFATALIPGVGPVLALGLAGAALLGAGGAVGGAVVGNLHSDGPAL